MGEMKSRNWNRLLLNSFEKNFFLVLISKFKMFDFQYLSELFLFIKIDSFIDSSVDRHQLCNRCHNFFSKISYSCFFFHQSFIFQRFLKVLLNFASPLQFNHKTTETEKLPKKTSNFLLFPQLFPQQTQKQTKVKLKLKNFLFHYLTHFWCFISFSSLLYLVFFVRTLQNSFYLNQFCTTFFVTFF